VGRGKGKPIQRAFGYVYAQRLEGRDALHLPCLPKEKKGGLQEGIPSLRERQEGRNGHCKKVRRVWGVTPEDLFPLKGEVADVFNKRKCGL